MATTTQIPPTAPPAESSANPAAMSNAPAAEENSEKSLVSVNPGVPDNKEEEEQGEMTGPLSLLPIEMDVSIPIRDFRVRNLLALEPGSLLESVWHNGDDVPLAASDVQLAWCEFEVIDTDLAVRITRLS